MAKEPMDPSEFEDLLASLNQETSHASRKSEILFSWKGYFNAEQAAWLIHSIAIPTHRVDALRMLEPRLCRMSCDEARMILATFTVQNDKLKALDCLKRVLNDCQTQLGLEYILSAFPFDGDKSAALSLLGTVRSDAADRQAAGGHQGYGALGGLYTQARPLVPHLYGSLDVQKTMMPGKGPIVIPPLATPGVIPSVYTGHPSYAYRPDKSYAETKGYPGAPNFMNESLDSGYPSGAPPIGHHSGQPNPTGFPGLQQC